MTFGFSFRRECVQTQSVLQEYCERASQAYTSFGGFVRSTLANTLCGSQSRRRGRFLSSSHGRRWYLRQRFHFSPQKSSRAPRDMIAPRRRDACTAVACAGGAELMEQQAARAHAHASPRDPARHPSPSIGRRPPYPRTRTQRNATQLALLPFLPSRSNNLKKLRTRLRDVP
jgi:hypothetical protein